MTTRPLVVKLNNTGTPTPCARCDAAADIPVPFAASLPGEGARYVCAACLESLDQDLARLLRGYALDANTTGDSYGSDLAWQEAFIREGYLDSREALL